MRESEVCQEVSRSIRVSEQIQSVIEYGRRRMYNLAAVGGSALALTGIHGVVSPSVSHAGERCTVVETEDSYIKTCMYDDSYEAGTESDEDVSGERGEGQSTDRPNNGRRPRQDPNQNKHNKYPINPNIDPRTGILRFNFNQGDAPWGNQPYRPGTGSGQTYRSSGCGQTAFAMVASNLLNRKITPLTIGRQFGRYHTPSGTSHEMPYVAGKKYGLKTAYVGKNMNAVKNTLKKGGLAIALVGPGHFTRNGHFVVLSYDNKRNSYRVTDPNGANDGKEKRVYSAKYLLKASGSNAGHVQKLWTYQAPHR